MSNAFDKLHPKVQRWVYQQGWPSLREIQSAAIEPILRGNTDVLISASTAAGKTEAFFLPAISAIANQERGIGILYISPLKALINDQNRRLETMSDLLGLPVTPWHGDSLQSKKKNLRATPLGVVLITPESLESLIIREPGWVASAFAELQYVVIDEFHAFIGTERGQQLMSLLHRLEQLLNRLKKPIPRIALSATLGNLESVPASLRPNGTMPCCIIKDAGTTSTLKIQIKGYINPAKLADDEHDTNDKLNEPSNLINDLFKFCRGGNHLVFANSRKRTEELTADLSDMCEEQCVPNEFFAHHGSLSKELRQDVEKRLQQEQYPTTAICTMTLELGIDIGKVNTVIQVTPPHSVSSLRQRMGRSGRRGGPSTLRMMISEEEITQHSDITSKLRLKTIQSLAMIRLLISSKWYEPADTSLYHFSTLLHQVLAIIGQWGGVRAEQLFAILCKDGPFNKVSASDFKSLLIHMGKTQLITQLGSGELTLGVAGERIVGHYTFYAVFQTPEEYRIVTGYKTLGTIPVDSVLLPGQHIVFGGKRWKIKDVDTQKKVIMVEHSKGGKAPHFDGDGMSIHDAIRQEMFTILKEAEYRITVGDKKVDFADPVIKSLFAEAVTYFNAAELTNNAFLQDESTVHILPWLGDKTTNTLLALLNRKDFKASVSAGVISVTQTSIDEVKMALKGSFEHGIITETELAQNVLIKNIEKYDEYLPSNLLTLDYGAKAFDTKAALNWINLNT
ncbi:DEAD/DEAH box helicase [Rheinheimera sp. D18]|uniref:DEAD/DEAH box helicase n=1 Tax=Rheinheimera sp. D18 TaxID=2545632 RepID=UPI001047AE3B|nr:DEAD/DEAH box helicase [Rheinheimera sp. D18]QBL10489.1 DEAD/DEAH box helicase [Rheinheimera sp. D18]